MTRQQKRPFWRRALSPEQFSSRAKLYRIPKDGRVGGVCAGLADYWGVDPLFVRLGLVASLFVFQVFPLALYVVLWIIMPIRPEELYKDAQEEQFWQGVKREPRGSIQKLHLHYRKLEHRLRAMETEVTSAQYRFDQELKKEN